MEILGIDIGGSGIKGAVVDTEAGRLVTERQRIPTPQPATPTAVADTVVELVKQIGWKGPLGCTFPAIVEHGIVHSAANVDKSWIETPGEALFSERTGLPVTLINDADAAGIAEMAHGAGKGEAGTVLMLTFGTGIGSALFIENTLVPNTELGHIFLPNGKEAERYAADRIREEKELSWEKWANRLNKLLAYLDALFSPDLYIIGGGVSKKHAQFLPLLQSKARLVPATLLNEAGIVGAAMAAQKRQ